MVICLLNSTGRQTRRSLLRSQSVKISSIILVNGSREGKMQCVTGQGKVKCTNQAPWERENGVLVVLGLRPWFINCSSVSCIQSKMFCPEEPVSLSATKPGFSQSILPPARSSCI